MLNILKKTYLVWGILFALCGTLLYFSEIRDKQIMEINWCYGELEVDGSPIISSRYEC